ncbi:uncharacterized protein LOC120067962 [Benincasa hispida]|uniref:uncharacterized protein LOC120067962 n=1 Tax=Benincasa hispida TaxID=102211 RepID=UPI0018FF3B34|nr:uncharacterized protein LOC120067962 [Benincasa hispida]
MPPNDSHYSPHFCSTPPFESSPNDRSSHPHSSLLASPPLSSSVNSLCFFIRFTIVSYVSLQSWISRGKSVSVFPTKFSNTIETMTKITRQFVVQQKQGDGPSNNYIVHVNS